MSTLNEEPGLKIKLVRSNGFDALVDLEGELFYRLVDKEFGIVKWMEVKSMDGMCDPVDKRREECAVKEAQKERKVGADYMRQRHGLVESREPAYRPVGGKKKGKY